MPVHPRSRGEHKAIGVCDRPVTGSSPLARGTPPHRSPLHERRRFIPARAGNTPASPLRSAPPPVHPRSRGEHLLVTRLRSRTFGSSPLARGTQHGQDAHRTAERFIPARAGNTGSGQCGRFGAAVHPRSRGEHASPVPGSPLSPGSSPLARGTPPDLARGRHVRRFIPARAGNTPPLGDVRALHVVHPRSRGEHSFQNLLISQSFFDDDARTNGSVHIFNERETI